MKTSLNKLGIAALSRLAKSLNSQIHVSVIGLHTEDLESAVDAVTSIYLWDWEYGLVKVDTSEGDIIGNVILSGLTDKPTDSRMTTSRFSHVALYHKGIDFLMIARMEPIEIWAWKSDNEYQLGQGDYENRSKYGFH